VVGGERVVGDDVVGELGALATVVERIAGVDRYSTAAALSARTFVPGVETAYLVVGTSFADGLVAGPAAALAGGPVLLARGDRLPASTRAELARLRPGRIVVVGGTGAVPESVIDVLGSLTTGAVERWAGIDRYATSATVAAKSGVATVHVATGATASDALAAVPMVAATGGPLVLVGPDTVPASVDAALAALAPTSITVLGGPAAISEDIELRLSRHIER